MSDLTTPQKIENDFLARPLTAVLSVDWEKAIYIALILAAILTRFWDLGGRVMSHDESLHTQFSYQFYNGDGYQHTPLMHGPFLFHITALSYWLFGDSDLSARIPVAIFGVLLVAAPYLLRRWLGRTGALFVSFILLISPYATYYSRYIRHDVYVIIWALITFTASWYYLHERKEKYLWWFAGGVAMMLATKEVVFIYVAIFGSWLVIRLLARLAAAPWLAQTLPKLRLPIMVTLISILMIGGGFMAQRSLTMAEETAATAEAADEGFAADPNQATAVPDQVALGRSEQFMRWVQIAGFGVLALGLFLAAQAMRPHIDEYAEFDLIVLYTTLILPAVSPFLTTLAGWNPRDYTMSTCVLSGQETMSVWQIFTGRLGSGECRSAFFDSGIVHSGSFLIVTLLVAVALGLWWSRRRWLTIAVIFHALFAFFYTSVFTNPSGWSSGMIGSLGYWLEQQEVQRGSQPWFYYFFVTPFYEFLPIIFSTLAVGLWLKTKRVSKIVGYWVGLFLLAGFVYSFSNWFFNRGLTLTGAEPSKAVALILTAILLGAGLLFWYFVRARQVRDKLDVARLGQLWRREWLLEMMPMLTWWLLLTWAAYSYAGEKMPWLSIHFVIPMSFMAGWYFNERLQDVNWRQLLARPFLTLTGLRMLIIIAGFLALGPLFLGQIQFGDQQISNLNGLGRFLGSLVVAISLLVVWRRQYDRVDTAARRHSCTFAIFGLLSLLTIRATYMANFPNADYTTEYLNYAHGAPATKDTVMRQVEELSMRLYGDKSIKVAFSQDTSWPFTWYLREYPNRVYFGDSPSNSLNESPIILVGSVDWAKVEPYLGNNYEARTYTYLWWPMEEYRKISWNAIFGDNAQEVQRGLGNPQVRQALWNIFFYRDYTKYGEVFGGSYTPGEWSLRHELRLYIRKDVLATLWDYGIGPVNAASVQDPYAENEFKFSPSLVINESGVAGTEPGRLSGPRNVAVGMDGRLYVADSGNHRIQIFDENGQYLTGWGSFGSVAGQFNEPWGIAVDEEFVYVADTWNHRIQKFTLDGTFVNTFGFSGRADGDNGGLGLFFGPRDVLLLPDNRLLVTDTGNHRMQVVDRDGNFLFQVGGFGNLMGQFNEPVGLAAGPDGSVYLADTWNGRIQRFRPDLVAELDWPVNAWSGQSTNNKPYLAADSDGRVYVTDPEGFRVLIFTNAGDYLGRFGQFGTDANSFGLPNGIAIDGQNNIYITDATNNRVLKFSAPFGPPITVDDGDDEIDNLKEEEGGDLDNMSENESDAGLDGADAVNENGDAPTAVPTANESGGGGE